MLCVHTHHNINELIVLDVEDRLRRMYRVKAIAKALQYACDYKRGDGDLWEGSLFSKIPVERRADTLYLVSCTDGAVVETWKNVSYTPWLCAIANLPPQVRQSSTGLLLLALWKGVTNHNPVFSKMCDLLGHLLPGGPGLSVYDAYLEQDRTIWIDFRMFVNDTQGMQKPFCGCGLGSRLGSCPLCKVLATKWLGSHDSTYISAVTRLPIDHPERALFAEEFKGAPDIAALAQERAPAVQTHEDAVASGKRVEKKESNQKDELWAGVDAFTKAYQRPRTRQLEWDKIERNLMDDAHGLFNAVTQCLDITGSKNRMKLSQKRRDRETRIGRFLRMQDKAPFHVSQKMMHKIDELALTLRPPKGAARIKKPFHPKTRLKIGEPRTRVP